jgi:hypothetical protein
MAVKDTFPTKPTSTTFPTWATSPSAVKASPSNAKRQIGWIYDPTTGGGEIPRMDWVNNEAYNTGVWFQYFDTYSTFIYNLLFPTSGGAPTFPSSGSTAYLRGVMNNPLNVINYTNGTTIQAYSDNTQFSTAAGITLNSATGVFTVANSNIFKFNVRLTLDMSNYDFSAYDIYGVWTIFNLYTKHVVNTANNPTYKNANSCIMAYAQSLRYSQQYRNQRYGVSPVDNLRFTSITTEFVRNMNAGDTLEFVVDDIKVQCNNKAQTTVTDVANYIRIGRISEVTVTTQF